MAATDIFKRGTNKGLLAFAIILVLIGISFLLMAIVWNYTLSFSGFALPQWSMYVITVVMCAVGAALIPNALKSLKCVNCNSSIEYREAHFKQESKDLLIEIIDKMEAHKLSSIPQLAKGFESIILELDYCKKCGKKGILTLIAQNNASGDSKNKNQLLTQKEIPIEVVNQFAVFMAKATKFRKFDLGN